MPWPQPTGEEVVLIRFNVSRAAREAELSDLVPPASADGLPGLRAAS